VHSVPGLPEMPAILYEPVSLTANEVIENTIEAHGNTITYRQSANHETKMIETLASSIPIIKNRLVAISSLCRANAQGVRATQALADGRRVLRELRT
jgi:hypothetical protein